MVGFRSYENAQLVLIGDSHAKLFSADFFHAMSGDLPDRLAPDIRTIHVGPATAWHLSELGSTTQGREKALYALDMLTRTAFAGWVMFSFGTIDLHLHITHQALFEGLENAVKQTVDRYCRFLNDAHQLYGKIAVWGPIAAVSDLNLQAVEAAFPDAKTCGTECDRNYATMLFTEYLKQQCALRGIPVLSVLDMLLQADGTTDPEYYSDGIHLNAKILPFVFDVLEMKLHVKLPKKYYHPGYTVATLASYGNPAQGKIESDIWSCMTLKHHFYIDALEMSFSQSFYLDDIYLNTEANPQTGLPIIFSYQNIVAVERPIHIQIRRWAQVLWLRFSQTSIFPSTLLVKGPLGYFSLFEDGTYSRLQAMRSAAQTFALGDEVLGQRSLPGSSSEFGESVPDALVAQLDRARHS